MKEIEIPFGAKDSELKGWEYTIPEGMEAEIKDGKIVVREKESEDERIRKGLVRLLTVAGEAYVVESTGIKKESYLAYLEKQKENPKSADSIPSDCVSDAKCEDRWHKVGDSLPDNPREVLCKDEAGNYFIGRYYVGEGWEISNYDDEDKPHHLNPPVSKWIDFPSEKQKEQKPAEWSEEDKAIVNCIVCCLDGQFVPEAARKQSLKWFNKHRRDFLNSPSWKPSEEQMEALKHYVDTTTDGEIELLYKDLEKLM